MPHRTHGRKKQRPAPAPHRTARCQGKVKGQRNWQLSGLGEKCAHPTPAPHCRHRPEPVKGALLDRTTAGRQAARRTPPPPHVAAAVTRRAKRAQDLSQPQPDPHTPAAPAAQAPHPGPAADARQDHAECIAWAAIPPATAPGQPSAQAPASPAQGRNPRSQAHRPSQRESGQSQEPPQVKTDIKVHIGASRCPDGR
jgi:hypothetical protein